MAGVSSFQLTVERCEPELIAPSQPTPYELKYISDIDNQVILRFQIPVIQFYRKNEGMRGRDPVKTVKQGVARALVHYYPFAGRLREGANRKLLVECTGEGVLFIEANANVALDHFADPLLPPFPAVDDFLYDVPGSNGHLNCPLLLIQITRLTCGGFIFALRLNHSMTDAPGLVQLMNAISEMAGGLDVPSVEPVWKRELLMARDPPQVTCVHYGYDDVPDRNIIMPVAVDDMVHRLFFFGPAETTILRNNVPSHLRSCSAADIVTACLWRCRIIALGIYGPNDRVRVHSVVNTRNKFNPPLPVGYYGNAMASATAETQAGELFEKPLGYALDLLIKARADVTYEYMRSLADYLVLNGQPGLNPLGFYAVSDVRFAGFGEVDFGWGKPVYGGPAKADLGDVPGLTSFYLPLKNHEGEDGLVATVSLPRPAMETFVMELDKLTKPPPSLS